MNLLPFPEESTNPKLFKRVNERGVDWEVAFYRSITRADGIILMGGGNATKISGQVAIGSRMPILSLSSFGGGAAKSVGNAFGRRRPAKTGRDCAGWQSPGAKNQPRNALKALFDQHARKQYDQGEMEALADDYWRISVHDSAGNCSVCIWRQSIRGVDDVRRSAPGRRGGYGNPANGQPATGNGYSRACGTCDNRAGTRSRRYRGRAFCHSHSLRPTQKLADAADMAAYAKRSIPFALAVRLCQPAFTSDAVFGKLFGMDVVRTTGLPAAEGKR